MTNFATPVYIALLAVMLVLPSPAADWISKVHEFPLIKQMNGSSNDYFTNSRESMMCFPHPESPRLSSYASDHLQLCSGNGHYEIASHQERTTPDAGACHCYGCFSGKHCEHLNSDCDLNIFQYANSCPISFYTIHITEYSSFVCAAVESSSPDWLVSMDVWELTVATRLCSRSTGSPNLTHPPSFHHGRALATLPTATTPTCSLIPSWNKQSDSCTAWLETQ